jgi:hypothetical protein
MYISNIDYIYYIMIYHCHKIEHLILCIVERVTVLKPHAHIGILSTRTNSSLNSVQGTNKNTVSCVKFSGKD